MDIIESGTLHIILNHGNNFPHIPSYRCPSAQPMTADAASWLQGLQTVRPCPMMQPTHPTRLTQRSSLNTFNQLSAPITIQPTKHTCSMLHHAKRYRPGEAWGPGGSVVKFLLLRFCTRPNSKSQYAPSNCICTSPLPIFIYP